MIERTGGGGAGLAYTHRPRPILSRDGPNQESDDKPLPPIVQRAVGCLILLLVAAALAMVWYGYRWLNSTPTTPIPTAAEIRELITDSDDFDQYADIFVETTQELIADGRCSRADLVEMGGWYKSNLQPSQPIYFTYCGETTLDNRLYLNVETGRVFR